MPPLLLRGGDERGWLGAQRRRWMQGARPAKCSWSSWSAAWSGRAATDAGSTHHRLTGTNGAAIDGLSGDRRGAASGHARPGGLLQNLSRRWARLLLLQARHHIGARRDNGSRGRLSGEVRARLRAQGRSGSWARQWRRGFAGRRRSLRHATGHRLGWVRNRSGRRHRRGGSGRRQRLPRSRQYLPWPGRGNRARRNWTGAYRRMQRRSATG
jgi:hypothetical protein